MRRVLCLQLVLLTLCACAAPAEGTEELPEETPPIQEESSEEAPPEETEDHVVLSLEAPLADGRTLRLEAVGKVREEFHPGIREVRVYDGDALIQTVSAREGIEAEWPSDGILADPFYDYTECWFSWKGCMEALDLNFDGNTDFGLFGWPANNTIPYYYWIWEPEAEQYQYAFVLQEAESNLETQELTSEYKSGSAGSQWIKEVYRSDENGKLYLTRLERKTYDFDPEPPRELDFDRGWAEETWVPPEDRAPISPRDGHWSIESDLVLVRREVPVYEIKADNTVSHFAELWELQDGELKLTSREEYIYENQP